MKKILIFAVAILLITSCITQQKRQDIFHRYARENKVEILEYCPPVTTETKPGQPDTLKVTDTVKVKVPYVVNKTDTLWIDCPEAVYKYIRQTDTLFRENTALLEAELLKRQAAELESAELKATLQSKTSQVKALTFWLLVAILFAIIGWVIAMRRGLF
jgi:hypothetical protein